MYNTLLRMWKKGMLTEEQAETIRNTPRNV